MTHDRRESMLTRGAVALAAALAASSLGGCAWIERANVGPNGTQANDTTVGPQLSDDGRFMVFSSRATNLLPPGTDTNGTSDVFVRDLALGTTTRVSTATGGAEVTGTSDQPAISADGRYVAFASDSPSLVPGDTNAHRDIFVKDRTTNVTTRVSIAITGVQGNNASSRPAISGDGRYVIFDSLASTFVGFDSNGTDDIFLHDRQTGGTERVNLNSSQQAAGPGCWSRVPSISDDGRFVVFQSRACAFGLPAVTAGTHVWLRDRALGTLRIVAGGSYLDRATSHSDPVISGDGRHVIFTSFESDIVPQDFNQSTDVFLFDRVLNQYEIVSLADNGVIGDGSVQGTGSISDDGRWVGFSSNATNLVAGDTNGSQDAFVRDRATGRTFLVSTDLLLALANDHTSDPQMSGNGKYLAFRSSATNLVSGDTNALADVFLKAVNRPTIDFITPATVVRGFSGPVMIAGVAFEPGAAAQASNGKIKFTNVVRVDDETITATMTVAADTPIGNHDLVVGNPGGAWDPNKGAASQCTGCLHIQ